VPYTVALMPRRGDALMDTHAKLRWRCRRGMRELDVVLGRFLEQGYEELSESQKLLFGQFLELQDPELYAYVLGRAKPQDPALADLLERIRNSHRSAP
jgi:antitoxin CptB